MKKILDFMDKYKSIILSGLLGAVIFVFIYGIEILDPTEVEWLISGGGDLNQHYLGWEFFRRSPWTFPIGMNSIINYPFSISVIFTDSIPLFALFFKLFSNVLPEYFQYFGLYGIMCFTLQGIMASLILKKFIKNDSLVILFSLFFIISPVMIFRMYYHTSLASHYLILFGFVLLLYKDKLNLLKTVLLWGLLGFLTASTHIYFLVFGGLAVVGYMIYELITTHNFKKIIFSFISYLLVAFLTVYLLGGFSTPVNVFGRGETIGTFNFNLNGYFNAFDNYSILFEKLPLAKGLLQEEGFAYLGLGNICSLFIAIISLIIYVIYKLIKKEKLNINIKLGIVFLILLILSVFVASANRIYLGNNLLLEYKLPDWLWELVGVFRSNGRFAWLGFYVIMIGSFYLLSKCVKKEFLAILVIILFGMQIYDMSDILKHKTMNLEYNQFESNLTDERWNKLFKEDFKNIVFTSEFGGSGNELYSLYLYAMKNNKTINRFYIAQGILYNVTETMVEELSKNPSKDDIFLIDKSSFMKFKDMNLNYYKLDNVYIATALNLDYLEHVSVNELDIVISQYIDIKLKENMKYHVVITGIDDINKDNINIRDVEFEIIDNTISLIIDRPDLNLENPEGKKIRIQIREIGKVEEEHFE